MLNNLIQNRFNECVRNYDISGVKFYLYLGADIKSDTLNGIFTRPGIGYNTILDYRRKTIFKFIIEKSIGISLTTDLFENLCKGQISNYIEYEDYISL